MALFTGCSSTPKQPERFTLGGFSITAPKEEGWVVVQRTADRLVLGKPGDFSGETLTVQALVVKLPPLPSADSLLQHARAVQQQDMDPKRFRILRHEVGPYVVMGEPCALSQMEAADRTAATATGPTVNTTVETLTLTCAHPRDRTTGISVTYAHRHYPEDKDPQFIEKGSRILEGLGFSGI